MRSAEHHLFFSSAIMGDRLMLSADETRHAMQVLRLRAGQRFTATDGKGVVYECVVDSLDKGECSGTITKRMVGDPLKPEITCYIGLPEHNSFETILENLVPLGVSTIVPMVCAYCQKQWWKPSWNAQNTRFHKKMIAGLKQSLNPWLPALEEPIGFTDAVDRVLGICVTADEEGTPAVEWLSHTRAIEQVSCFIGPPGGFAPEELALLKKKGCVGVRLSSHRLRTELAAVVLCGMFGA